MKISWSAIGAFVLKVAHVLRPPVRDVIAFALVTAGLSVLVGPFWQDVLVAFLESKLDLQVPIPPRWMGWTLLVLGLVVFFTRYLKEPSGGEPTNHRRQQDQRTLERFMSCVHVPTFEQFVEAAHYHRMRMEVLHFYESFHALANSEGGHIHNKALRGKIAKFDECWQRAVSFGKWFTETPNADVYRFMAPHETNMPGLEQARDDFVRCADAAKEALSEMLDAVRKRHPEIDLQETNRKAWHDFLEFEAS